MVHKCWVICLHGSALPIPGTLSRRVYLRFLATCVGDGAGLSSEPNEEEDINDESKLGEEGKAAPYDHQLTPAERRYIEQREQIDVKRLAKTANKSHRDRIQDFNQYLANMSEHYDIPKVGPG